MLGISVPILLLIIASYSFLMATNIEQQQQQQLSYEQINQNQNLSKPVLKEFPVLSGSHPHDVAPVANGGIVWYTAQALGKLGWLDPNTGSTHEIALGLCTSWCHYRTRWCSLDYRWWIKCYSKC
jgi:streptogramin lyase